MSIAIIGGGISGLATAFYLKRAQPDLEITLYEKAPKLGGKMMTQEVEGFLFEEGSNGFLSNKPDTLDLVKACGAEALLLRSSDAARVRFIYKESLEQLPESPMAFLKTPLLSLRGKLRVAGEFFVPPRQKEGDETLQSFGYRRVGKEMTDTFLDPLVAGVFASAPDKISVQAAFPAVVALEKEYGGLFKGMMAKRKKEAGPGGVLMSFEGGVSSFVQALADSMEITIHTDAAVERLIQNDADYTVVVDGEQQKHTRVVLATPAFVSADLVREIDPDLAAQLDEIEYSPISVVGLGYDHLDHPLRGFGLLTTASAQQEILGVLWDSSIFDDRAPEGKKALRVMIGGQRNPDLARKSDDELVAMAIRGVEATMGITTPPTVTYAKRWERGIPNYRLGHLERMEKLFATLKKHTGLHLSANAYFGVGLNDCIANSKQAAENILADEG
jgi:oxygen-dependent protoporphyrinogen oxidase